MFKTLSSLVLILTLTATNNFAQTCCSSNKPSQEFAMLGNDKKFVAAHAEPLAFNYLPAAGEMVSFKASDGKKSKAFLIKAAAPSNKFVFVFHEWWGLNDYIKQTAEALQKELGDVNVMALDLYDGQVTNKAELASQLTQQIEAKRCLAIILGAGTYVGENAQIQTIGWCFGGTWSMQAAEVLKAKTKGCVIYYGMPEKDKEEIAKIKFPVLGIFAEKDQWIKPEVATAFEKSMQDAGKTVTIKMYDADHAFANPSNPKHNVEFTADAHNHTVAFIKKNW
jgi:carboxymethylenebutenolidase